MELVAREVDIGTRLPTVLLNGTDAEELGIHALDRVQIKWDGRTLVGIVELTDELVTPGTLGVTRRLGQVSGPVEVTPAPRPTSVRSIRKKLDDVELERDELAGIVRDIHHDRLNDVELAAFVCGTHASGLSLQETMDLTEAMTDVGEVMAWDEQVVADKHSIGGVAGNRVTPVVVPIVAACGLTIPKTSSRAVTSPAGTADTMEVFCDVEFSVAEIRDIVRTAGGCVVWGGAVNLSPVDDKIIRAETPLSLDPPGQIIASVLSKKESAGSTHVVIDVPYGEGAKVTSLEAARDLAADFKRVGDHRGLALECTITRGDQPVGRGIGPVLEARDVLHVLRGDGPEELRLKSERLAQILLDLCEVEADAAAVLESARALEAFRDIVAAQHGDPDVSPADLQPGEHTATVTAGRDGVVTHVDNRRISEVARRAGAPRDRRAGLYLHARVGQTVGEGADLFTVYAETAHKLEDALSTAEVDDAVRVRHPDEALVERI